MQKNNEKGITLVEIMVVIFIIALFSAIMVADMPKIKRQFALSRASYRLAQNLRRAEDLSLSGVYLNIGGIETKVKGYGIYISSSTNTMETANEKKYILYADNCPSGELDSRYTGADPDSTPECVTGDYVLGNPVLVDEDNGGVYIKSIIGLADGYNSTSIEFVPPNPATIISNLKTADDITGEKVKEIEIILGLESDASAEKTVYINTSGLIKTE